MSGAECIKAGRFLEDVVVEPFSGVAGLAGAMRAVAPGMPPNTSAPGRAAEGPRQGYVPQAQAALQRLKHASAPPRSYGLRLELAKVHRGEG